MLVIFRRKQALIATIIAAITLHPTLNGITQLAQNDPYPMYTSLDPHNFLYTHHKQELKGFTTDTDYDERFNITFSPFSQSAHCAGDLCGKLIPLGDINGRWGMIGLLFGSLPQNTTEPSTLASARAVLFPNYPNPAVPLDTIDPLAIDPEQQFGFFSIPVCHYRKTGLRFETSAQIIGDLGIKVQAGLADIMQTGTFDNLTSRATADPLDPTNPAITKDNINETLMSQLNTIANELHYDLSKFHVFSAEDLRGMIYWRHAFPVNTDRDGWARYLFVPFLTVEGSVAVGKARKQTHVFALPFGSNDHNAVAVSGGFDIDFNESIEFGGEIGFTHFFPRTFCNYPVPNSSFQSGVYPFLTTVNIQPGMNVNIGAKIAAYRFLERLSFYFQYMLVEHKEDCIRLTCPDPAFMPKYLESRSPWKVHLANIGFTYDIAPSMFLGFLWQAPLKQYNAFKSTTVLFSLGFTF